MDSGAGGGRVGCRDRTGDQYFVSYLVCIFFVDGRTGVPSR